MWVLWLGLAVVTTPVRVAPEIPPTYRAERPRREIWSGTGQIIQGPGSGGSLRLTLEIEGEQIRTLEGPPVERRGEWDLRYAGNYLYVTLTRPNGQVINFNLVRSP